MVGELILISYHVVVLDTVELPFEFLDFGAICVHLIIGIGPVFVEMVDDQHGVSVYHEVFDTELDGHTEFVETCFIFGGVVGGRKVYPENVFELILGRCDEQNARTSIVDVKGAVEVHHSVLRVGGSDGLLDLSPLSDEISKRLRLDRRPTSEFNGVSAELDSPLDDMAVGLFVAEDVVTTQKSTHQKLQLQFFFFKTPCDDG